MAEGTESALEHGQSGYGRLGRADEDAAADERTGLHAGGGASGPLLPHRTVGRKGHFGLAPGDSAEGFGRGLERSGRQCPQPRQAADRQGSGDALADVAIALVGPSRDGPVSRDHGTAAGGGAKDQEFLYQVAAGAAEDSVAGDDRTAHHAADAGVSEDRERCLLTSAGWQAAFANGDAEVSEAAGAATSTASAAPACQARPGSQSSCCRGCGSQRQAGQG